MKKVVLQLKRTLSTVLALMMVATSVPQAAMTVMAAEDDYEIEYEIVTFTASKDDAVKDVILNGATLTDDDLENGVNALTGSDINTLEVVTNDKNTKPVIAGFDPEDGYEVVMGTKIAKDYRLWDDVKDDNGDRELPNQIVGRKTKYIISGNQIKDNGTFNITSASVDEEEKVETKKISISVNGVPYTFGLEGVDVYTNYWTAENEEDFAVGSDVIVEIEKNPAVKYTISQNGVESSINWDEYTLENDVYGLGTYIFGYITVEKDEVINIITEDDSSYVPASIQDESLGMIDPILWNSYFEDMFWDKIPTERETKLYLRKSSTYDDDIKVYDLSISGNGITVLSTTDFTNDWDEDYLVCTLKVTEGTENAVVKVTASKERSSVSFDKDAGVAKCEVIGAKKYEGSSNYYLSNNKDYELKVDVNEGYSIDKVLLNGEPLAKTSGKYIVNVANDANVEVITKQDSISLKATLADAFKKVTKVVVGGETVLNNPKGTTINTIVPISSNMVTTIEFEKEPNSTDVVVSKKNSEGEYVLVDVSTEERPTVLKTISSNFITFDFAGETENIDLSIESYATNKTVTLSIPKKGISISANDIEYKIEDGAYAKLPTNGTISNLHATQNVTFKLDYSKHENVKLATFNGKKVDYDSDNVYEIPYVVTAAAKQTVTFTEEVNENALYWFKFAETEDGNFVAKDAKGKDITNTPSSLAYGEKTAAFTVKPISATEKATLSPMSGADFTISENGIAADGTQNYIFIFNDGAEGKGKENAREITVTTSEPSGAFNLKYDHNVMDVLVRIGDRKLEPSVSGDVDTYMGSVNAKASITVTAKNNCCVYNGANTKELKTYSFETSFKETDPETTELKGFAKESVKVLEGSASGKEIAPNKGVYGIVSTVQYTIAPSFGGDVVATISDNSVKVFDGETNVTSQVVQGTYDEVVDIIVPRTLADKTLTVKYIAKADGVARPEKTLSFKVAPVITDITVKGAKDENVIETGMSATYVLDIKPKTAVATKVSVSENGIDAFDAKIVDGKLVVTSKVLDENATTNRQSVITVGDDNKTTTINVVNKKPELAVKSATFTGSTYNSVSFQVERAAIAAYNADAKYEYQVSISSNSCSDPVAFKASCSGGEYGVINSVVPNAKTTKQVITITNLPKNKDDVLYINVKLVEKVGATVVSKTDDSLVSGSVKVADATFETKLKLKAKAKTVYTDQTGVLVAEAQWSKTTTARELERVVVTEPDGTVLYDLSSDNVDECSFINGNIYLSLKDALYSVPVTGKYTITAYAASAGNIIPAAASVTVNVVDRRISSRVWDKKKSGIDYRDYGLNMLVPSLYNVYKPYNKAVKVKVTAYDYAKNIDKLVKSGNKLTYKITKISDNGSDYTADSDIVKYGIVADKNGNVTIPKNLTLSGVIGVEVTASLANKTASDNLDDATCSFTVTPNKAAFGKVVFGNMNDSGKFEPVSELKVGESVLVGVLKSTVGVKKEYALNNDNFLYTSDFALSFPKNSNYSYYNMYTFEYTPAKAGKITVTAKDTDGSKQSKKATINAVWNTNAKKLGLTWDIRYSLVGDAGVWKDTVKAFDIQPGNDYLYINVLASDNANSPSENIDPSKLNLSIKVTNAKYNQNMNAYKISDLKKPVKITVTDKSKKDGATISYTINNNAAWVSGPKTTVKLGGKLVAGLSDSAISGANQNYSINVGAISGGKYLVVGPAVEYSSKMSAETLSTYNTLCMNGQAIINGVANVSLSNSDLKVAGSYKMIAYVADNNGKAISQPQTITIKVDKAPKASGSVVLPKEVKISSVSNNEIGKIEIKEKVGKSLVDAKVTSCVLNADVVNGKPNGFATNFDVVKTGTGYSLVYVGEESLQTIFAKAGNKKDPDYKRCQGLLTGYVTVTVSYGSDAKGCVRVEPKTFKITVKEAK